MRNPILPTLIAAWSVAGCSAGGFEQRTVGEYQSVRTVGGMQMSLVAETELPADALQIQCPDPSASDGIDAQVEDGTLVITAHGDANDCSATVAGESLVRIELSGDGASAGSLDIGSDGEFHVDSLSAEGADLSAGGDAVLHVDEIDARHSTATLDGQAFLSAGSLAGDDLDIHLRGGSDAVLGGLDLGLLTVDASGNSSLRAQGAVDRAELAIGGNAHVDLGCTVIGGLTVDLHGGPIVIGGDTEIDHGIAEDCEPFDDGDLHDGHHEGHHDDGDHDDGEDDAGDEHDD